MSFKSDCDGALGATEVMVEAVVEDSDVKSVNASSGVPSTKNLEGT